MRLLLPSCVALLASLPAVASAQHLPLPDTVVALDSPEGMRLFEESQAKADYGYGLTIVRR